MKVTNCYFYSFFIFKKKGDKALDEELSNYIAYLIADDLEMENYTQYAIKTMLTNNEFESLKQMISMRIKEKSNGIPTD